MTGGNTAEVVLLRPLEGTVNLILYDFLARTLCVLQINEILIEFDLDASHDGAIGHPTPRERREAGAPE